MDEAVDVAETDLEQRGEQRLREGRDAVGRDVERAVARRPGDGVAGRAIIEGRQDDDVGLPLQVIEHARHRQRVHAQRQMLAVILQHAERQDDRPVAGDRVSDLVRQHEFIAHGTAPLPNTR